MQYTPASELLKTELDNITARVNKTKKGITSGYPSFDQAIGGVGFEAGMLYVLGARPSMGKTAFALNVVVNQLAQIEQDEVVVYISSGASTTILMQRILAMTLKIDLNKIQLGNLTTDELTMLNREPILDQLNSNGLVICENAHPTVANISEILKELNTHGKKPSMLIIDTIQSIQTDSSKNKEQAVKDVMNELRVIAEIFRVPVLITSDVSRRVEYRQEHKIPQLWDLLHSRFISEKADFVIMLVRPDYYELPGEEIIMLPEEAHLIVQKNKYGPLDTIVMHTDIRKQLFMEAPTYSKELINRY